MSIQPSQPQSIGGVLDTTFQLYKSSVAETHSAVLCSWCSPAACSTSTSSRSGANPADPLAMVNLMHELGILAVSPRRRDRLGRGSRSATYLKVAAIGTAGDDLGIGAALQAVTDRVCPRWSS